MVWVMNSTRASSKTPLARLGRMIFPRRLWVGLAVVGIAAFLVEPRTIGGPYQRLGTAFSLAMVLLGLGLRAWAAGCAGRHTREAKIEAPALVTGGPYAYVRNPIYLASIVLGLGMVGLIGDPWLLAMHAGVCVLLYAAIIPAEEQYLQKRFGTEYERYCAEVPRMIPRSQPWAGAGAVRFDARALVDQLRLGLILICIYYGLHFAAWLRG
jgi:protein-S-isoprenylcysteine O-methyltransferase Ste14